jgi:hypothetical protein
MNLSWSCTVRKTLDWLSLGGLGLQVFGSSCALGLRWSEKLVLVALSPFILIALGWLAVIIKRRCHRQPSMAAFTLAEEFAQMVQVVVMLSHSSLTQMAMVFFAVEQIDAVPHLRANISTPFFDESHQAMLPLAVTMIVYAAAVPVLFIIWMNVIYRCSPEALDGPGFIYNTVGSLYAKQKTFAQSPIAPVWEAVTLIRKFALNAIVVFLGTGSEQATLSLGLLIVSISLLAFCRPYSSLEGAYKGRRSEHRCNSRANGEWRSVFGLRFSLKQMNR